VLLVLRLEVEGALPEPGRWGDEWNAPLMTMFRRGQVTYTAMESDQIRSDQSTKQVRCWLVFVYAVGGKPGRRGCSIRGERVVTCLLCLLRAMLDG
jgi:hypothetical protein